MDYIIPPHIPQEDREELKRLGGVKVVNILNWEFPKLESLDSLLKDQEGVLLLLARHGYRLIFKFKGNIWTYPPDLHPHELRLI